jgi:hypothetical protein
MLDTQATQIALWKKVYMEFFLLYD